MPKPKLITHKGQAMSISKWAKKLNISRQGLCQRLAKGLAISKVLKPRDSETPTGGSKW